MPQAIIAWIASALTVTVGVATVIYYVAVIAIAYGISQAQARKAKRKARDAYNASLTDRLVMTATADGIRSRVYGRIRNVEGIVFKATRGDQSRYYTLVVALAGHEIDGIETIYFNDIPLTLVSDGAPLSDGRVGYWVDTDPFVRRPNVSATSPITVTGGAGSVTLPNVPISGSVSVTYSSGQGDNDSSYSTTPTVVGSLVTVADAPVDTIWTVSYQYVGFVPRARIWKYTGTATQDLSILLAPRFPSLISSADKFRGIAALVVELEYDQDSFSSGVPGVSAVVRGAKILDTRTSVTAWSENPALIAYDWATYANGGGCSPSEIVVAAVNAAANACDVSTDFVTPSGTETRPLFQCGIGCRLDGNPDQWMDEIAESMAGKWAFAGGQLTMVAGTFRAPVATITEDWVAFPEGEGANNVEITAARQPRADAVNVYRPTIADAAQAYVVTPVPEVRSAAYITADGQELVRETSLTGVTRNVHAQHVCGIFMRDAREDLVVTLPCNLKAWTVELFDVVYLTLPRFGFDAKTFEVLGWKFSPQTGVTLTLKETAASIFDPAGNFDNPNASPNTALPSPWIVQDITGLSADSGTNQLIKQSDGTIITRVLVTWDPATGANVTESGRIDIRWGLAGSDESTWQTIVVAGSDSSVYLMGAPDGQYILIKARAASTLVRGEWCAQILHFVVGKTEPPPDVVAFTVVEQPAGMRQFYWNYPDPPPVDLNGFLVRYVPLTLSAAWADMVPLFEAGDLERSHESAEPLDGEYRVSIKAIDTSGNESVNALEIGILLDQSEFGTLFMLVRPHELGWPGTITDAFIESYWLRALGSETWDTIPIPWDAWLEWDGASVTPISYEHPVIELASDPILIRIRATAVASSPAVIEIKTSDDDITYSAWGPVPAGAITTRYIRVRWTVAGANPVLYRAQVSIYA